MSSKLKYISNSEKQTYNLAKKFAGQLVGGEVLCLIGDLGAGKTAFTKGLAAGLGVKNIITSPTFVLMKVYDTVTDYLLPITEIIKNKKNKSISGGQRSIVKKIAHIDAYRLNSGEQLLAIGADEYLKNPSYVTVIEWADRVRDIWPSDVIEINFKIGKGNKREINIK